MPEGLEIIAALSLAAAILPAVWIAFDEWRRPQHMAIMNFVWPITALYAGPLGLWAYLRIGRMPRPDSHSHHHAHQAQLGSPTPAQIAMATSHCGAGCTLGDILAEAMFASVPGLAAFFGWHHLWQDRIFSTWIVDFILAFGIGILFQYFSLKPMHPEMSRGHALRQALQADALSLLAWQIGMYAVMALAHFWIFPHGLGVLLPAGGLVFWWVMQFAMLAGFVTAYPVNRSLVKAGIKEAM